MLLKAISKNGDILTLSHLRQLAKISLKLQFISSAVYLFCAVFLPGSISVAVCCGVMAILISFTPVFYAFYTKHFLLLFSCISVFNIAPIWFLYKDSVLPGTDTYFYSSPVLKTEAFFWIAMFQFLVNSLYYICGKKITRFSIKTFSFLNEIKFSPKFYLHLSLITFFLPLIGFYLYYDSLDTLWLAATGGRSGGGSGGGLLIQDAVGNTSSFMLPLNLLWQLTPLFSSIGFFSVKNKSRFYPVFSFILGLLVIFVFFLGGSRGTMMFVAAPVLFFLIYSNFHRGLKFWIPAAIAFFAIVAVMELQVRFRGNLLTVIADPEKAARQEGLNSVTTLDPTAAQHENNMYLFCLMIKGYPDKYQFEGYHDFFATIVNPIPRAIWPGKPILNGAKDISYQPKYIVDGPLFMGTTSLTFSVVGEAYLSGGFMGLLLYSIVYSSFLLYFDGVIYYTKNKQVLSIGILGVSVFLAFWGYRALFALVTFIYPLILFILLFRLIKLLKTQSR